jgi:hypothetical protein
VLVAEAMLDAQPPMIRERLASDGLVVMVTADDPGTPSAAKSSVVIGYVRFHAGLAETYRLLSQTARQIEYRTELKSIETLEQTETGPVDQHRIKILFLRYDYHLQYHLDPEARSLRWELDPDYENDLARVDGSWELFEMQDGDTLGRFTTGVEVADGIPRFVQDYFTRKNLPSTLGNCRRWVNSKGRFRP